MKKEKEKDNSIPSIIEKNPDLTPEKFFSNTGEIEKEDKLNDNDISNNIDDIIEINDTENTPDSYFKNVIDKLFSGDDISLKTEYEDKEEVFTGTKLEFLTSECGFKFGERFLPIREKKMVSNKRQSRQEIIMSMWQKEQQIRAQEEQEQFKKHINM